MDKKTLEIIKKTTTQFLKLLDVETKAEIKEDSENQAILIQLEAGEPGVLIGYHGETIAALQLILGIMINKKLKEWRRIVVNIGDYREKREEALKRMALSAAQRAHFSGKPVVLDSLSSAERRIIHLVLKEHSEVETYSEGEDGERKLIVKPR